MSNLCRVVESNFKFIPVMKRCLPIVYNAETLDRFSILGERLILPEDYVNTGRAKERSGLSYIHPKNYLKRFAHSAEPNYLKLFLRSYCRAALLACMLKKLKNCS